jgi:hypothetical protein
LEEEFLDETPILRRETCMVHGDAEPEGLLEVLIVGATDEGLEFPLWALQVGRVG